MLYVGLYGIQAARYYLNIHPEAQLCVLEADDEVGGVWSGSMHRLYLLFELSHGVCFSMVLVFLSNRMI